MAPHTLSPNRDLNQSELNTLEALVDATSIEAVIQGLSEICGAKAEHIAHNWQDTILAKRWQRWRERWEWRPQRRQGYRRRLISARLHAVLVACSL